jgi:hypothetical protein
MQRMQQLWMLCCAFELVSSFFTRGGKEVRYPCRYLRNSLEGGSECEGYQRRIECVVRGLNRWLPAVLKSLDLFEYKRAGGSIESAVRVGSECRTAIVSVTQLLQYKGEDGKQSGVEMGRERERERGLNSSDLF